MHDYVSLVLTNLITANLIKHSSVQLRTYDQVFLDKFFGSFTSSCVQWTGFSPASFPFTLYLLVCTAGQVLSGPYTRPSFPWQVFPWQVFSWQVFPWQVFEFPWQVFPWQVLFARVHGLWTSFWTTLFVRGNKLVNFCWDAWNTYVICMWSCWPRFEYNL